MEATTAHCCRCPEGGEAERPGGTAGVRRAARYHRVGSYVGITAMKAIPAFLSTPSQTGRLPPPISTATAWTVTQHSWDLQLPHTQSELRRRAHVTSSFSHTSRANQLSCMQWVLVNDTLRERGTFRRPGNLPPVWFGLDHPHSSKKGANTNETRC